MNYLQTFSTRKTPQSEPLKGQVPNSAGGHAWQVDDWARLSRFLILGSEGGTYYVGEYKLTRENAEAVVRCVKEDGTRVVEQIVSVNETGRAPKNDPAIFVLAIAAGLGDEATRRRALSVLPRICRTGTHLFHFASYAEQFRGWGRGLRRAVGEWYEREDVDSLAYQLVKYRQRDGWTHRDLLRLAHVSPPTPEHDALYAWTVGKAVETDSLPPVVAAYVRAQESVSPQQTAALIAEHPDLPREALNPEHLSSPVVWEALLDQGMPMTALIRNLATMTRIGLLTPMSAAARTVCEQIGDDERLRKARVHPLAVLAAMATYAQGWSQRSGQSWTPVAEVVDALDAAFYAAFGNVEPSGKRTMLALDVSGSMAGPSIAGMPGISPRAGSAAMALVTAAVEPQYMVCGFTQGFIPLPITPRQRLSDVVSAISRLPFEGTDCAVPMLYAAANNIDVDTFVVYTDSETWAGNIHPSQALQSYRQKTGIGAKLVVVGMVSNGFSIAAPDDPGMLDVVGFDVATPNVISEFAVA